MSDRIKIVSEKSIHVQSQAGEGGQPGKTTGRDLSHGGIDVLHRKTNRCNKEGIITDTKLIGYGFEDLAPD